MNRDKNKSQGGIDYAKLAVKYDTASLTPRLSLRGHRESVGPEAAETISPGGCQPARLLHRLLRRRRTERTSEPH